LSAVLEKLEQIEGAAGSASHYMGWRVGGAKLAETGQSLAGGCGLKFNTPIPTFLGYLAHECCGNSI